jgi:adenylate kinase
MAAALDYMHCGDLVPDSTVREMVRERSGCLLVLDGFPRTLGQAEALSQLMEKENLALSAVVNYELPAAEIVSRLSGRQICEKCKAVFTLRGSRSNAICDECGGDGCSNAKMTGRSR